MTSADLTIGLILYDGTKLIKVIELHADHAKCKYLKLGYSMNLSFIWFDRYSGRYEIPEPEILLRKYKTALRKQTMILNVLAELEEALGPVALAEAKIKKEIFKLKK
jgi:hypothetical protein